MVSGILSLVAALQVEMSMEPSSEPASGPGLQFARIGGVLVTRQEIVEAIDELEESTGTWILPRLIEINSPLAQTDYKGLADRYQREHPEDNLPKAEPGTHPARRRMAFIRLLERQRDDLNRRSGSPVNKAMASVAEQVQQEEAAEPLPLNDDDARRRVYAEIVRREGQQDFRLELIRAYSGRCAITGCDAIPALEAAHLRPYLGPAWNVVSNGLLLRADIHTLFDLDMLTINPETRQVVLSRQLSGTQYQSLSGVHLFDPRTEMQRPSQDLLIERWCKFQENESAI